MADFVPAYAALRRLEGRVNLGYVNDPDDKGGETVAGISRRYHPKADVWVLIDGAKKYSDFPRNLERAALRHQIEMAIGAFYFDEFWTPMRLEDFPDQDLADEMLEHAVHLGIGPAVTNLQLVLNSLNLFGKRWNDLKADGQLGQKTVACVHAAHHARMEGEVLVLVNCLQGARYVQSRQEKFIRGWAQRVTLAKGTK